SISFTLLAYVIFRNCCTISFSSQSSAAELELHSFPTRRSSDLLKRLPEGELGFDEVKDRVRDGLSQQLAIKHHLDLLRRERDPRSEEHTSELQSRGHLVCRLLLEKKKQTSIMNGTITYVACSH